MLDIIVGETAKQSPKDGQLWFFPGTGTTNTVGTGQPLEVEIYNTGWNGVTNDVGYLANAIAHDFNGDDLIDLLVSANHKYSAPLSRPTRIFWNSGTKTAPSFSKSDYTMLTDANGKTIEGIGGELSYGDLDNDSIPDLLITAGYKGSTTTGADKVYFYKNRGYANQPDWGEKEILPVSALSGTSNHTALIDVDGDKDLDLLISGNISSIKVYENFSSTDAIEAMPVDIKKEEAVRVVGRKIILDHSVAKVKYLSLRNVHGQLLFKQHIHSEVSLPLSGLSRGVYVITYQTEEKEKTITFVFPQ